MIIAHRRLPQGQGLAAVLLKRAPTLTLDWDLRQRSRFDAPDSTGRRIGVILPRGQVLRGGDALLTEDGEILRIVAAPQPVLQVSVCAEHGGPFDLMRAVYHLANRHVPLDIQPTLLQFEPDPVLADMLRQLGLIVTEALAPFEPEGGAYGAAGGAQGHGHGHGHEHVHSDACGHDHDHGHGHSH